MSSRGITDIILNGEAFELHPTFSNLDKLETVLNKGAIGFLRQDLSSGAFKAGDVVSIIQVCAVPANGRKFPNWWNRDGVGEAVISAGLVDITTSVTHFLAKALTAGTETDIKTVGSESDEKK